MFDSSFWTSVDPLRFHRVMACSVCRDRWLFCYVEWVRYLLERVEFEYHCGVPWWDSELVFMPDCAPAARVVAARGTRFFVRWVFMAVVEYGDFLDIDFSGLVSSQIGLLRFATGRVHQSLVDARAGSDSAAFR